MENNTGYVVFTRTERRGKRRDAMGVRIGDNGRVQLNALASEPLLNVDRVVILWDSGTCKMALRAATDKDEHTWKLTKGNKGWQRSVSLTAFLKTVGYALGSPAKLPATWDPATGLLEIQL